MPTAIFSDFLVAAPSKLIAEANLGQARAGGRSARPIRLVDVETHRDALRQALSASFERVLRHELVSLTTSHDAEVAGLASRLGEHVADLLAGRSVVLKLNQELDGPGRGAMETFLRGVIHATGDLDQARQEAAIAKLAEIILPDPLMEARGALALDNLELRDRFVAEEPVLTSAEVGEQSGHRGHNPYATAARWKKAGKVFSINHRGAEYFPAFQFRDGQPHPTIARILAELPKSMTPWQVAFWFVSTNGWLDDDTPKDRLDEVERITAVAKREGEEVMG